MWCGVRCGASGVWFVDRHCAGGVGQQQGADKSAVHGGAWVRLQYCVSCVTHTAAAQRRHSCGTAAAQLRHSCGTAAAQLQAQPQYERGPAASAAAIQRAAKLSRCASRRPGARAMRAKSLGATGGSAKSWGVAWQATHALGQGLRQDRAGRQRVRNHGGRAHHSRRHACRPSACRPAAPAVPAQPARAETGVGYSSPLRLAQRCCLLPVSWLAGLQASRRPTTALLARAQSCSTMST